MPVSHAIALENQRFFGAVLTGLFAFLSAAIAAALALS